MSAGRPVTAETFWRPSPAVSPDSRPTSRVISTMTVPIRAKRPLANFRSLQATNMASIVVANRPGGIGPGMALPGPEDGAPVPPFDRGGFRRGSVAWNAL
ncbi:hypothetical protein GCM10027258_50230 [Amycolatopsis stemonae]